MCLLWTCLFFLIVFYYCICFDVIYMLLPLYFRCSKIEKNNNKYSDTHSWSWPRTERLMADCSSLRHTAQITLKTRSTAGLVETQKQIKPEKETAVPAESVWEWSSTGHERSLRSPWKPPCFFGRKRKLRQNKDEGNSAPDGSQWKLQ